ncbi:response regulator transcription factor [Mogibacterium kristiansenii]|uniref:Stage 0 sporulation protein A homolog n=2 Tax=Anaerovoracaceae TaxID=543314 RepID=A0A6N7X725_9FIRM|nr:MULTISPECIES: response regulator transcription factor [Mogibacterium]MCI7124197.1 response regulator transcription factor [Mogibacterium sp.]MEE0416974.1 response regulator transcription factor [Clostridia bacterium]MST71320.1 response regulator transcription factor [Mogibacterium kristiansenii]
MNILVCDDDKEIVRAIGIYLKNEGYRVLEAYDGIEALDILRKEEIHLIIMDIMMPRMDGMQATVRIREEKNIPIIMLSAKSEDYDKIGGLGAGADDYVTKPFNPMELIARVKSQLRRYTTLGSMNQPRNEKTFQSGGLILNDDTKEVTVDGTEVRLTPTEYRILALLTANAGRVYTIYQIYDAVWEEPAFNPENTVAVHIRHIREKIEINPKEPRYLKVVWGTGYKIEKY